MEGESSDGELSRRDVLTVFSGLLFAIFLAAIDQTIIATALPTIVGDLGSVDGLSWVVTGYLLTSTIAVLLMGKASDLYGRRRVYQAAMVVFAVGSTLAALAQSIDHLIVARAVQGVGGGGITALSMTIIGEIFSARERGRYMGFVSLVAATASVGGPLLGGVFADSLGWRWIFVMNIPIAAAALAVVSRTLRLPPQPRRGRIDYTGAALIATAVTALLLLSVWGGHDYAWTSPTVGALGALTLVAAVLFVLHERRVPEPLLPLRLFGLRTVAVCVTVAFLLGSVMFGSIVFLPLFLQVVSGVSATASGILLLPLLLPMSGSAVVVGRLIAATGRYRLFPVFGMALSGLGLALLSLLEASSPLWVAAVAMAPLGMGIGMTVAVLTLAVQNAVDRGDLGTATSAVNFMRSLGGAIGIAAFGGVLSARLTSALDELLPAGATGVDVQALRDRPDQIHLLEGPVADAMIDAFTRSITLVFLVAVPACVVAVAVATLLPELPLRERAFVAGDGPGRDGDDPATLRIQ